MPTLSPKHLDPLSVALSSGWLGGSQVAFRRDSTAGVCNFTITTLFICLCSLKNHHGMTYCLPWSESSTTLWSWMCQLVTSFTKHPLISHVSVTMHMCVLSFACLSGVMAHLVPPLASFTLFHLVPLHIIDLCLCLSWGLSVPMRCSFRKRRWKLSYLGSSWTRVDVTCYAYSLCILMDSY